MLYQTVFDGLHSRNVLLFGTSMIPHLCVVFVGVYSTFKWCSCLSFYLGTRYTCNSFIQLSLFFVWSLYVALRCSRTETETQASLDTPVVYFVSYEPSPLIQINNAKFCHCNGCQSSEEVSRANHRNTRQRSVLLFSCVLYTMCTN
jgi:hypothetical protein